MNELEGPPKDKKRSLTPAPKRRVHRRTQSQTPLAPRHGSGRPASGPGEDWKARFARALPEVAQRAAGNEARILIEALSARSGDRPDAILLELLEAHLDRLDEARVEARRLRRLLHEAQGEAQVRSAMTEVLQALDGGRGLGGDRRAMRRNLDVEGVEDRLLRREHAAEQPVELLCVVVGATARIEAESNQVARVRRKLLGLGADRSLRWTVREAALRAVGSCAIGADDAEATLDELERIASDGSMDPWVQATALGTWLRLNPPAEVAFELIERVLDPIGGVGRHPDHAFFRARAVGLAARRQAWAQLRRRARSGQETSEHVQIAMARALAGSPSRHDLTLLLDWVRGDQVGPRVKAAGALAAVDVGVQPRIGIRVVRDALATDPSTVRIVLSGLHYRQRPERLSEQVASERLLAWRPSLQRWRDADGVHPDVRVDAAAVLLALEIAADPELVAVWKAIDSWAIEAGEGEASSLRTPFEDEERLLDILALVAQHTQDLGATRIAGGWRLFHGPRVRPAIWRFVHEVFNPRPDKRQAISHLVDRYPRGRYIAPSGCMSEVTRTTVPGRPVSSPTEHWWAPDLPLPSWMMVAATRGDLEVRALPDVRMTLSARGRGRALAPTQYARLANLRESVRDASAQEARERYDRALDAAGFGVKRHGLGLLAAGGLPFVDQLAGGLGPAARELFALDGNTLPQLAVFSVLVGAGWATMAAVRQQRARAARGRVPLVIGGWGSRGKSGVERLKAALFHELGYPVLSKTTGNEAMVVVGLPGREPVEIFLYRPYDRASIVEQREVLHLADRLGVQVLLWECMALNPRYVDILQQDWMRDDLTTITNTYPDHEDIMGPSGIDVAEAIARVLPRDARAVTAEQAMTPVLAAEARRRGTQLDALSPEAWELLPADVLARFPYHEHPRNIALVVALGRSLGIRSDVALRAMADRVVPDLGVLKAYGPAEIEGRDVSFIVGNSANERAGFLSNWQRMDFNSRPDGAGLLDLTALVVNNRADRLARQSVFASVAALDAPVDRLVVIGTNVRPFVRAFEQVLDDELRPRWKERLNQPRALAERIAARLRRRLLSPDEAVSVLLRADPERSVAAIEQQVGEAFEAASIGRAPAAGLPGVGEATARWLAEVAWLAALAEAESNLPDSVIEGALRLVKGRTVALPDPEMSGEAITDAVVATAPARSRLRMLGAANIKGTGLDLVYRWVQIDRVRQLLDDVLGPDPTRAASAIRTLAKLELGSVDRREVTERLQPGLERLQDPDLRVLAEGVLRRAQAPDAGGGERSAPAVRRFLRRTLANVDVDSVIRRRAADRLYADLARGRVGLERAAKVAKDLVSRQKVN